MQSEVSQKEKKISYINIYLESRKMVLMNRFAGQKQGRREWICGHGREGEGGTIDMSNTDTYMLPCVKQIASGMQLDSTEY